MPNWCENDLTITGPKISELLKFIQSVDPKEKSPLDFNKIIPYPKEFAVKDAKANEFREKMQSIVGEGPEFEAKRKALRSQYGVKEGQFFMTDGYNQGGYEWCNVNWGTKWNACEARIEQQSETSVMITFNTAWSPPLQVLDKLAVLYPSNTFKLACFECGAGYKGNIVWKMGKMVKKEFYHQYRGRRGG